MSLARRLWGASRLHPDTYEEVEADRSALRQAALVVAVAALSSGAGTALRLWPEDVAAERIAFQGAVSVLLPVLVWVVGSAFAYMTGASFFRAPETETDFPEVLRTTGFAFAPGWGLVLQATPPPTVGILLSWGLIFWVLAAGVVAIRQALDFSTGRALGTFGTAAVLLWLVVWGLVVVPLPI